jgi:hypothetical protein
MLILLALLTLFFCVLDLCPCSPRRDEQFWLVVMTNIEPMTADRGDIVAKPSRQRSRVANGTKLLPMTDGRSATARRFKDLTEDISQDMGVERLSELERQLIRRASMLCAECERMEAVAARGEGFDRVARIVMRPGRVIDLVLAALSGFADQGLELQRHLRMIALCCRARAVRIDRRIH